MFCGNCGRETKEETEFCPYCGAIVGENGKIMMPQMETKKKRMKKTSWIPIVLVICVVIGVVSYQMLAKEKIKVGIEEQINYVKNGGDPALLDEVLQQIIPQVIGSEAVGNMILSCVRGEDVQDIAQAMMCFMNAEVMDVKMVRFNEFQASVRIVNLNNLDVLERTGQMMMEEYFSFGGAIQGVRDLMGDKSKILSQFIIAAGNDCYNSSYDGKWIQNDLVMTFRYENGEWRYYFDQKSFIFACLGLQ